MTDIAQNPSDKNTPQTATPGMPPQYRKLVKNLSGTRKTLMQACRDVDIDLDEVDDYFLDKVVSQCSHCDIWGTQHKPDLDQNPICGLCFRLVGA